MHQLNRRRFLYLAAGASGAWAASSVGWRLSGDRLSSELMAHQIDAPLAEFTRTSRALGADVSMTALHEDRAVAKAAVNAAFAELELVESVMSIYRPESQLSRLNRTGVIERPHPYLVEVLRQSRTMSERSGGAFDVTVQPLWALFRQSLAGGNLPDDEKIAAARQLVDWRRVDVADDRVQLHAEGAAITLNGIAQGYAADRAMDALRAHGITHALVDAGELGALGRKSNEQPWKVGIQHPRREDAFVSLAELDGRCLATSGDYSTTFSADFAHHHLFDPRSGKSSNHLSSASIAAGSAALADALSTAVFVLGPAAGLDLVRATPGADALLVDKRGRVLASAGFPRQV